MSLNREEKRKRGKEEKRTRGKEDKRKRGKEEKREKEMRKEWWGIGGNSNIGNRLNTVN